MRKYFDVVVGLFSIVAGILLVVYLFLLLPAEIISRWSLENIKLYVHGFIFTESELAILAPISFLLLFGILAGCHKVKKFLSPHSEIPKRQIFARVLSHVTIVFSTSAMVVVLWDQLHKWGWAGVLVTITTAFFGLITSYFVAGAAWDREWDRE